MKIGDILRIRTQGLEYAVTYEHDVEVVYIHPSGRWFAVEVKCEGGNYWTCFMTKAKPVKRDIEPKMAGEKGKKHE